MQGKILQALKNAELALQQLSSPLGTSFIERGALALAACFQAGGKVLIAGNGGSLCDATHFAEELTGIFRKKRRALPAIAFSESGHLTCVANDLGFDQVFARAVEAYGKPGDLFIGLTTSGLSPNIILAFEQAKAMGLTTLALLGKSGGKLKGFADIEFIIEGFETSDRIQEAHMTAIHIMIELMEELLFNPTQEELFQHTIAAVRK
jgi:D-sedoheptulose 7-phosphate isomerase